jgi:hypothetical protein
MGVKHGGTRFVRLVPGETVMVELPYSEVCMHMQIAGAAHEVELIRENRSGLAMAQILDGSRRPLGGAVTPGEAGIYCDNSGYYAYAVEEAADCRGGDCDGDFAA